MDGVTSKSDFLYKGKTTGRIAAEIVVNVLAELSPEADVQAFVGKVNQAIAAFTGRCSFPIQGKKKGCRQSVLSGRGFGGKSG